MEQLEYLRSIGDVDELANYADRVLNELPVASSELRFEAESNLAFALSAKDDPISATDHAQRALLVARDLRDTSRILGALYQLTKICVEGRHFVEADEYRKQHYDLAKNYAKDKIQLALGSNSMGSMHNRKEDLDSAEHYFREGLRFIGNEKHVVKQALYGNLASLLGEKGFHVEAEEILRSAMADLDSADLRNKAWSMNNLGQTLMHAGRFEEALVILDESDSLNKASGNALDLSIELAEIRAQCFDSLGDFRHAYVWMSRARDLQDTLFERSMNEQLLELEAKFNTRLKEEEIERLDAQSREQQEKLRSQEIKLYGSLALALLSVIGIFLMLRNLRQKREYAVVLEKLNVALNDKKDRIEEVNRLLQLKVLRTQMNPHFIYNSLNAIHSLVIKNDTVNASGYLDGFARLLRMVLDHSVKERVPLSDEISFLRQYLKLESLRFDNGVDFSVNAEPSLLDDDLLIPTLLIQPFVENAIWHGLATKQGKRQVNVSFMIRNTKLICAIEDNGVGRDPTRIDRSHPDGSQSMGVQLTNERLQLLAYSLEGTGRITYCDLMEGDDPVGTRVEVILMDL